MAVNPKSLLDVFLNLREFFANKMHRDPASLFFGTNVRADGNFDDPAWSQVGAEICALAWAKPLGLSLPPATMQVLSTLSDVSFVIWDEINDAAPVKPKKKATA